MIKEGWQTTWLMMGPPGAGKTLLVRYVTDTQPPQILEDLATFTLGVYGDKKQNAMFKPKRRTKCSR